MHPLLRNRSGSNPFNLCSFCVIFRRDVALSSYLISRNTLQNNLLITLVFFIFFSDGEFRLDEPSEGEEALGDETGAAGPPGWFSVNIHFDKMCFLYYIMHMLFKWQIIIIVFVLYSSTNCGSSPSCCSPCS